MWSDTLLAAERDFLVRFGLWGGCSITLGAALLLICRARLRSSPIVLHFAAQTLLWGAVAAGLTVIAWSRTTLRDYTGARQLYAVLSAAMGLDLGLILIGGTLAVAGWVLGRRLALVGAGAAIFVQGAGWLVLQLQFAEFVRGGL